MHIVFPWVFRSMIPFLLSLQKSKVEEDTFTSDSGDERPAPQPRARPGRAKRPVQYLEESSEDDLF